MTVQCQAIFSEDASLPDKHTSRTSGESSFDISLKRTSLARNVLSRFLGRPPRFVHTADCIAEARMWFVLLQC